MGLFRRLLPQGLLLASLCLPMAGQAAERGLSNFLAMRPDHPAFPLMLLFGLLAGALTFFKPKFGLVLMLLFIMVSTDMPTKGESIGSRAATIRMEDLVLVLVSGGWLLNRAVTRSLAVFKAVPINRAIWPMAIMIVLSTILGYLQGTVSARTGLLFGMKRLEYFWIFFMTLNLIDTEREARIAVRLFLGVAMVIALIGTFQFFLFPLSELAQGGATATTGFGRANTFADFLLIVTGCTLGLMLYAETRRQLQFASAALVCFIVAILMTKSRGAYVSLMPLLMIILVITRSRRGMAVLGVLAIMLASYFVVKLAMGEEVGGLVSRHYNDFGYQFDSISHVAQEGIKADSSLNARYGYFWQNVEESLRYPFFGRGVGAVPLGWFDVQYLRELHETGLLGLLAFCFMNGLILLTALHFYHRTSNQLYRGLAVGFLGGQVGILVHGLTIENFYTIFNMEAFWFLLALLMVFYDQEVRRGWRAPEETEAGRGQDALAGTPSVGLIAGEKAELGLSVPRHHASLEMPPPGTR